MNHSDLQINGIYKIKEDRLYKCGSAENHNATHVRITDLDCFKNKRNTLRYDLLKDGKRVRFCWACFKPEDLELYEESPKKKSKATWQKEPDKYTNGDDWYTKETVYINGKEMTIEDFKEGCRRYKSLESSYNRNFPF